ncbi:GmrSD restriction endonuclease domain-containing protein [Propionibacteriaceae bacterium Y1923]
METSVKTPMQLFGLPQYLRVPLFQRPYVWDEERQWAPLWEDVRRVAEYHKNGQPEARHFLGAVVTQQTGSQLGRAETFSLVDGQQRLTTLQLLMNAAAAEFELRGFVVQKAHLEALTHNEARFGFVGVDQLKVTHLNEDREPFQLVMLAEPPLDYEELPYEHRIPKAHQYFGERVRDWLDEDDSTHAEDRAAGLTNALTSGLEFVVITLGKDENSQAIFETLNARGTPLTQADLVKNAVFERLEAEGDDVHRVYTQIWKHFETKFWTSQLSLGRYSVSRIEVFLNHWLVAQLGEEVGSQATFTRFKQWSGYETTRSMHEIVGSIEQQATQYRGWIERAATRTGDLDTPALFAHRTQAAGYEAVKPILLWLYDPANHVPGHLADEALRWVESWVLRRALLRRASSDLSRVIAALVREAREVEPGRVADRIKTFLSQQDRPGTYWPPDREFLEELVEMAAYQAHSRSRLRMILESIEDDARGYNLEGASPTGSRVERDRMHIEHVLPQAWRSHWPVEDLLQEVGRDAHVHRLGNLTLLTQTLNTSVSNGPWSGPSGKRAALERHDVLLMNRPLRDSEQWDEQAINARTLAGVEALLRTWPAPEGHDVLPSLRRQDAADNYIELREMVAIGQLAPGTVLYAGGDRSRTATVTKDGALLVEGEVREYPSGAAQVILGHQTNGWQFWRLEDGRRLAELRSEFHAFKAEMRARGATMEAGPEEV